MIEPEVTDGNTKPSVCYFAVKCTHLGQNTVCAHNVYIVYVKPNDTQASPERSQRNMIGGP